MPPENSVAVCNAIDESRRGLRRFFGVVFRRIELPTKHPPSPNYGAAGAKGREKGKGVGAVLYTPVRLGPPKSLGHDSAYPSKFSVFGVFRGLTSSFF